MIEIIYYEYNKIEDIVKRINEFGIKYIMATFDEENYLFTDYVCRGDMAALLTIENHSKEKLYIENCNSGYVGTGPRQTEYLLKRLGIDEKTANKLSFCNGFSLEFDEDYKLIPEKIIWELPFVTRAERCGAENIFFDTEYMAANLGKKQLYFVQPRGDSYKSLLSCIDLLKVEKICVYIGSQNRNYFTFDVPYNLALKQKGRENVLNGSYFYIEANPFDIIYFVGNENPVSMINVLYYYMTGKILFAENMFGEFVVSQLTDRKMYTSTMKNIQPRQIMRQLLSRFRQKKEIYYSVDVVRGRGNA